ncbi:trehalose-phosphatase [Altererythrobacter lutimaris]|uniref:Trehalose 6-phosphate phosphatase n=1 Tax=Altererythrobacter lutimaris TaxID=2743979 RepID=A0A850HBP2_9SPHN|nr:trehalose-phosphatase [Altererythrobacter lutimaris]NVE94336.1 trehalose-phosphatase [Altererythrobacter lutimaris]
MSRALPLGSPPPLSELCAAEPVALFLDFDGTLVEIASSPDAISVPTSLPGALRQLSQQLEGRLAVVSGRSLEDLSKHLGEDLQVAQAGSHGAARRFADGSPLGAEPDGLPDEVVTALEDFAASKNLRYEAKTHGGALHYRENPEAGDAAHEFAEHIAAANTLAIKTGKCVVELVHKGADKASAVRAFMEQSPFAGATPVFLGDDVTDEDGFAACEALGGCGILVGDPRDTNARYGLASVSQTHQWLDL